MDFDSWSVLHRVKRACKGFVNARISRVLFVKELLKNDNVEYKFIIDHSARLIKHSATMNNFRFKISWVYVIIVNLFGKFHPLIL